MRQIQIPRIHDRDDLIEVLRHVNRAVSRRFSAHEPVTASLLYSLFLAIVEGVPDSELMTSDEQLEVARQRHSRQKQSTIGGGR
jgi:hypothetical protein